MTVKPVSNAICDGYAKIGLEIGEHGEDYEKLIEHFTDSFDISAIDFVLIYTKPLEIREQLWYEWAEFFRENKIYFAFLYTQQRGAPEGKKSHLTREMVQKLKEIAGCYFVGDMIGETGGLASWQEGYYEDIGMVKPDFADMHEAKENYVNHVKECVQLDRQLDVPAVLAVEATTFNRYNFEAGVDNAFVEVMCGNPEVMFASARGAGKAYGRRWWGAHIAPEWYGGLRNDDPLKYKRLKLSYYYSFISGAEFIYPESGHFSIQSYGSNYGADSEYCKTYRKEWDEFSSFVHLHKRPEGQPEVRVGFLQGNLDSWTGWGGATVWNMFGRKEWEYGAPEYAWKVLDGVFNGEKWHNPAVYGCNDLTSMVAGGMYDIVPVEAPLEVFKKYDCLMFLGWNTMTADMYEKLKEYVAAGGRLFASVPHMSTGCVRGAEPELLHGGDFSDLFGCKVRGKGAELNWGVKFVNESSIPGYVYPYTSTGICDPICANGSIRCADVELNGGRTIALLSDRFIRWKEGSPSILVENSLGKGYASLITAWDYPGTPGLERFMQVVVRTMLEGEYEKFPVKILCCDKVHYAAYKGTGGSYALYLINTGYDLPQTVKLSYKGMEAMLEIGSCDIRSVYVDEDILCSPESKWAAINRVDRDGGRIIVHIAGDSNVAIHMVKRDEGADVMLAYD